MKFLQHWALARVLVERHLLYKYSRRGPQCGRRSIVSYCFMFGASAKELRVCNVRCGSYGMVGGNRMEESLVWRRVRRSVRWRRRWGRHSPPSYRSSLSFSPLYLGMQEAYRRSIFFEYEKAAYFAQPSREGVPVFLDSVR